MKACCALHNWIRKIGKLKYGITEDVEDTENAIFLGSWQQDPAPSEMILMVPTRERHFTDIA